MQNNIVTPSDSNAKECAELIYMAGSHIFSYLYNLSEPDAISLLSNLYYKKKSSYSKDRILVYQQDDVIKGLIIAMPYKMYKECEMNINNLIQEKGLLFTIKYMFRGFSMMSAPKIMNDEYYVGFLAVFSEYRGQGIGVSLLKKAEEKAKSSGMNNLSLYVEDFNSNAKRIYEKFGFQEIEYKQFPKKCHKFGLKGIYKMLKKLD